jgi:DNA integrity scanning protein DisA with diadenylate cyclase activity
MRISPKYYSVNFNELNLHISSSVSDWQVAVDIFENRYSYRFIKQINVLRENPSKETAIYSGFAIMALNCLLIETLNQFLYGVNDTDELKREKAIKHINKVEGTFIDFLTNSKSFKAHFKPNTASIFYHQIRCGLLHQAETKKGSRIVIDKKQKSMVEEISNNGISIRRDIFTDSLITEYDNYKICLLTEPTDEHLRENFIKKMNMICDETK